VGFKGRNRRWARTRILCAVGLIATALVASPGPADALIRCNVDTDVDCPLAVEDFYKTTFKKGFSIDGPHGVLVNDRGPISTAISVEDSDTSSFYGNAAITFQGSGGAFTYTPDPDTPFTGLDTFDYEFTVAGGDFDFTTVTVEVDPIMKANAYNTPFNTPLTVAAPGVRANDLGVGDIAGWDATTAHGGSVTMDPDGGFVYTPPTDFQGADTFNYSVDDIGFDNTFKALVTIQVGSGTTTTTMPPPPPPPKPQGYWMVGKTGSVYAFGAVKNYRNSPTAGVTHLEPTPTRRGYWIVNAAGHVFAHGDAKAYGNASGLVAHERVTSLSSSHSGHGYWLFTDRGRVLARGDAKFYGDTHAKHLNGPIVGSVATSDGKGYYLVGSDGGIFTYGDAVFQGSMGNKRLNKPVNGLVPTKDGRGYWLVASDGGIFAFNAPYRGSMGGKHLNRPIIGMVRYGNGYLMVGSDGGIFNFSNQPFLGSLGGTPPAAPIVGVATGT
jgi:hypothetical protein